MKKEGQSWQRAWCGAHASVRKWKGCGWQWWQRDPGQAGPLGMTLGEAADGGISPQVRWGCSRSGNLSHI